MIFNENSNKIEKDWEERKFMTKFLEKFGWQLSKSELYDVIYEYDLIKEWEDYKKANKG